jgi:hypothetical protein
MRKGGVILLARELLKIRISMASKEPAEGDGVHKSKTKGIYVYDNSGLAKWYREALSAAESIIVVEEEYLGNNDYKHMGEIETEKTPYLSID